MSSPFKLTRTDFENLIPERAVYFFRDLMWAEAHRIGLPVSAVRISLGTSVADGKIDASISRATKKPSSDLIKNGFTGFQVKAGTSFKPWRPAALKKELFGEHPVEKKNLGDSVRKCLEKKGRYFLACFGVDPIESDLNSATEELGSLFAKCGYSNASVAVWGQCELTAMFQQFPSLVLAIQNCKLGSLQYRSSWSKNKDMGVTLEESSDYQDCCNAVREILRDDDRARHVRVLQEAGSGKTRFVFELLRSKDLAPLVLYSEGPTACKHLLGTLCLDDDSSNLILVS